MAYDSPAGLIAMSAIFEFLAIAAVALRFLSRRRAKAGFWIDDWLIVAALICATGLTVNEIYGAVVKAFGVSTNRSLLDLETNNFRIAVMQRLEFVFWLLGHLSCFLAKLSIAFFYRRIFGRHSIFGPISIVWISIVTLWGIAFSLEIILQCGSHLHVMWDGPQALRKKYCHPSNAGGAGLLISGPITDFITLLLPLPWVAKLNTSFRNKLGITSVFAIGSFSVVASCVKAAVYFGAQHSAGRVDLELLVTSVSVWNFLEAMVGIIVACAMTIRPLLATLKFSNGSTSLISRPFRSLRSSIASSTSSSSQGAKSPKISINSPVAQSSEKAEASIAVNTVSSTSDIESGYQSAVDLHENETLQAGHMRKSEDLGHIAVEKTYSIQVERVEHNTGGTDFSSNVPQHVAPFHYRSTTPHR